VFVAFVVLGLSVLLSGGSGSEAGADLTPAQRRVALEQAEQADRSERAELLTALTAGTLGFAAVLARSDEVAQNTRVGMVVRALPGYDPAKAAELLRRVGVDADRRLSDLRPGQVRRLSQAVSRRDDLGMDPRRRQRAFDRRAPRGPNPLAWD
jgi:hypothetical protein